MSYAVEAEVGEALAEVGLACFVVSTTVPLPSSALQAMSSRRTGRWPRRPTHSVDGHKDFSELFLEALHRFSLWLL